MTQTNALLLVDIQNDYFEQGLWPVEDMERVAAAAHEVLTGARAEDHVVIHIRHEALSDTAPFFRPDTAGAAIHDSVAPRSDETVILKHRPNSFHGTGLHDHLQNAGVTDVTIIGAMTQMCIDATARAARDFGYDVTLVAAACGARSMDYDNTHLSAAQVQAAFLKPLEMSYASIR